MRAFLETLRGALYYFTFYVAMALVGAVAFPAVALAPRRSREVARFFFRLSFVLIRLICGVRTEVRGVVPTERVLVASKHQSMLDVFMIFAALPVPRFVMKRELTRAPIFGWFALRAGAVPVDRSGGSAAMAEMVARMMRDAREDGQIVIYPQGTRVAPGATKPYKLGVFALYEASGLPCAPVAVNTGLVQPRGLRVKPGRAVASFLDPIPPGLDRDAFMNRLEAVIEAETRRLANL